MPAGHYKRGASLEERFWSKVDKSGDCWIFQTNTLVDGYGRLKIDGKPVLAHRHAFALQHGPTPEGHDNVFQSCRNKLCVRGEHLYSGPKNSGPREERPTGLPEKGRYASPKWEDIPGLPGYEACIDGRIRSWWVHGHSMYADKPMVLSQKPHKDNGYCYATLTNEHGKTNALVHLCVLEAFVGPCPAGQEARHYPDRDKANNRLENLSYSTHQENMDDKHEHGTIARGPTLGAAIARGAKRGAEHYTKLRPETIRRGSTHPNAKISGELYDYIKELLAMGCVQQDIAEEVGVHQSVISEINTGKRTR